MSFEPQVGDTVPNVTLPVRVGDDFAFLETGIQFAGKRIILFALPGAFTPTCSTYQLPGFEKLFSEFQDKGIEEIYCLSVNDTFAMNNWFEQLGIENVRPLPDGNGEFTHHIGAEVEKANLGFGLRSWRYALVIYNGVIEKTFVEDGFGDNIDSDPYEVSTPQNVLENL